MRKPDVRKCYCGNEFVVWVGTGHIPRSNFYKGTRIELPVRQYNATTCSTRCTLNRKRIWKKRK